MKFAAYNYYLFGSSHFTLVGVDRPHAMESVIPDEICAQALSEAVRNAVSLSAPEADLQAVRPS